jgi:hypothetical protein
MYASTLYYPSPFKVLDMQKSLSRKNKIKPPANDGCRGEKGSHFFARKGERSTLHDHGQDTGQGVPKVFALSINLGDLQMSQHSS